jgi:hypothetical protein
LPQHDPRVKVFLAGTIDTGNSVDWQAQLAEALAEEDVMLLNPQLGLHAKGNKLVVYCEEGYSRKGNVDIVCERYKVLRVSSIDALAAHIKNKIQFYFWK